MNDLNRVMMIGRLTADPEMKVTPGGVQLVRFAIAVNRSYRKSDGSTVDEVSYFSCTAWSKLGEIIHRYAGKGKQVAIEGRLQQRRWESDGGHKQSAIEIVVDSCQLLGGGKQQGGDDHTAADPVDMPF